MKENLGNRADNLRTRRQIKKPVQEFPVSYDEPSLIAHSGRDFQTFSTTEAQMEFFRECEAEGLHPVLGKTD